MQRRDFIKKSTLTTTGIASGAILHAHQNPTATMTEPKFRLRYAPHLGMFKHSAGDDPIDQLKFMADKGFTAFEDNGMKNRTVAMQEKMAKTMSDLGIQMGVFVAHKIYWQEPNLSSGK